MQSISEALETCRACLKKEQYIKNGESRPWNDQLSEMFEFCTSIKVSSDDALPRYICKDCLAKLTSFSLFKKQCLYSNILLHPSTRNSNTESNENECDLESDIKIPIDEHLLVIKSESNDDNIDFDDLFTGNVDGGDVKPFIQSAASGKYNCGKCNRWYKHKIYYEAHVKSHETGVLILECDICLRQFDKKKSFHLHRIAHTAIKQFKCKICGKGFIFKTRLTAHEKTHLKLERVPCSLCEKTFKTEAFLKIHMALHSIEDKQFECENCKKSFKMKRRLNDHLKRCLGERSHMCMLCGKCFVTKYELTLHTRSHNGERPIECKQCEKKFLCHSHLVVHRRSHTGERPYACHICPKKFTIKGILDNHLLIHSGNQPYECSICRRPFRQRHALQTHMKTHNVTQKSIKKILS